MADHRLEKHEEMKNRILLASAKLFLQKGFAHTTVKEIAEVAKMNESTMLYTVKSKEDIIADLVKFVLEGQFSRTEELLKGKTEDPILFYAAETTLQLYMAESSEHVRELYSVSYSLPKSSEIIQHTITGKLERIFKKHLPDLETKDFYELEIASGGIMRGFMTVPCDMYFTMERKVKRFLETTFLVYRVSDEKIREAVDFVSGFDFQSIAEDTIKSLLSYFEERIDLK